MPRNSATLIPNFTQFPNFVLDQLLRSLSGSEWKVLTFIYRKTFGWHKSHDRISLSQIQRGTGLCHQTAVASARSLAALGLLRRRRHSGQQQIYEYEPVVNVDTQDLIAKLPCRNRRFSNSTSLKTRPAAGPFFRQTKETPLEKSGPRSVGCQGLLVRAGRNRANSTSGFGEENGCKDSQKLWLELRRHLEKGIYRRKVDAAYFDMLRATNDEVKAVHEAMKEAVSGLFNNRGARELRNIDEQKVTEHAWARLRPHISKLLQTRDFTARRNAIVARVVAEVVDAALDLKADTILES